MRSAATNAGGRAILRKGKLDVVWNYELENRELLAGQQREMARLAKTYGGTYGNLPTWDLFRRILTVHNLGGCARCRAIQTAASSTSMARSTVTRASTSPMARSSPRRSAATP